jgi:hypothetical protein
MGHSYGGDSAYPQPEHYTGKIWQVYVAGATPHVWTRAEVAELAQHGIEGVVCTVVPPQDVEWWLNPGATLDALAADAVEWGVPEGAPLELDVEAVQADAILAAGAVGSVGHAWAVAVRSRKLDPWIYSTRSYLLSDSWSRRRLAEWPTPTPVDPGVPDRFHAWQYAGGVDGDTIDLDVFGPGTYMSPDASGTVEIGAGEVVPPSSPAPTPDPVTTPAPLSLDQRVTNLEIGLEALQVTVKRAGEQVLALSERVTALEQAEKADPTSPAPGS